MAKQPGFWSKFGSGLKDGLFKFGGALFMEKKNGEYAVSLTRCSTMLLIGFCTYNWQTGSNVNPEMLHTLWGLLGIKGARDVMDKFKENR